MINLDGNVDRHRKLGLLVGQYMLCLVKGRKTACLVAPERLLLATEFL